MRDIIHDARKVQDDLRGTPLTDEVVIAVREAINRKGLITYDVYESAVIVNAVDGILNDLTDTNENPFLV